MPSNKYDVDLIIFDFDGTLTDSIPSAILSIKKMMKELGLPEKTTQEIGSHVGFGELPLVEGAIGSKDPALVEKALQSYYRNYRDEGGNMVELYPGVKEALELLKDKILIILSNKRDEFILHISERLGIKRHFKEIHGGDTAPCLKPDPCVVLGMLKKYKVQPERAMFVGDMTIDVQTGKNAGVITCAVTYGFDPKEKLASENPDLMVDSLLELAKRVV